MTRMCTNCKTTVSSHVLIVDNLDFHRKSCYCSWAGHKVEGDRKVPKPCKVCESGSAPKDKKAQTTTAKAAFKPSRHGRAVMVVS